MPNSLFQVRPDILLGLIRDKTVLQKFSADVRVNRLTKYVAVNCKELLSYDSALTIQQVSIMIHGITLINYILLICFAATVLPGIWKRLAVQCALKTSLSVLLDRFAHTNRKKMLLLLLSDKHCRLPFSNYDLTDRNWEYGTQQWTVHFGCQLYCDFVINEINGTLENISYCTTLGSAQ